MGVISLGDFRIGLHDKRSTPYGFGKDPNTGLFTDNSTAEKLTIRPDLTQYAKLNEAIYNQSESSFNHIAYGVSRDNLTLLPDSDYRVDVESSIIWFDQGYTPSNSVNYYAFYEGEGSIIWVEDVTSLQDVITRMDEKAVYTNGSPVMESDLNMGGRSITNADTIDSIRIALHSHTGNNFDAPQINTAGLADNAVQTGKILDDAVTTDKIKDFDVLSNNLGTYAVVEDKIAAGAVTNNKIANSTISASKLNIKSLIDVLYPVGSIYIGVQSVCPLAVTGTSWVTISDGYYLQQKRTDKNLGDLVSAGLPNITGGISGDLCAKETPTASGAFNVVAGSRRGEANGGYQYYSFNFDAANGEVHTINGQETYQNDIYGKDDRVQTDAIQVNIWKRIS